MQDMAKLHLVFIHTLPVSQNFDIWVSKTHSAKMYNLVFKKKPGHLENQRQIFKYSLFSYV